MQRSASPLLLAGLLAATAPAPGAQAACNLPPDVVYASKHGIGGIGGPFLRPDADVSIFGSGFQDGDQVAIAYLPPDASKSSVVFLRSDCSGWNPDLCNTAADPGPKALCVVSPSSVATSGPAGLRFRMPAFANGAYAGDVQPAGDKAAYRTGPARVVVHAAGSDPCAMVRTTTPCASSAVPVAGVKACIQELVDPSTGSPPDHKKHASLTGLPASNRFVDFLQPPANGNPAATLYLALDAQGNMLIPMTWTGVHESLVPGNTDCPETEQTCKNRDVSAWTSIAAFPGQGGPPISFQQPTPATVQSFSTNGRMFLKSGGQDRPRFEVEPAGPNPKRLDLVGDTDKHHSVLRVRRCTGSDMACANQSVPDQKRHFDLSDDLIGGVGAVGIEQGWGCAGAPSTPCDQCPGQECRSTNVGAKSLVPPVPAPAPEPEPEPVLSPGPDTGAGEEDWPWLLLLLVAVGVAWVLFGRNP